MTKDISTAQLQFAKDVENGLSASQKYLSSKYFYDAVGDKLFQQIMELPEYYLTRCEFEIFEQHKDDILQKIKTEGKFNLVELGAGDGYKTKILLEHFINKQAHFEYVPVDISHQVLKELEAGLKAEFPNLKVKALNHEYFKALKELNKMDATPKVILFLGSNIGNFTPATAQSFFKELCEVMNKGDKLLIGIDLKKNPKTILKAYNDEAGITRAFNLNLLERMNRELGANFDLNNWDHFPTYDPFSGECRSYLMSTIDQDVHFEILNKTFHFKNSEPIHMEISRKYSLDEVETLAKNCNFTVRKHFMDSRGYFVDSLWEKS